MWLTVYILCIVLFLLVLLTVRHYTTDNRKYWANRNIPFREPCPIFGNFGATFTTRTSYSQMLQFFYNKYKDNKYVGIFQARRPALLITDLDIVKQIVTEHASSFTDRVAVFTDTQREPLLRNLFNMSGSEWKAMRHVVTPTFSPAKMKAMFPLIVECAEALRDTIEVESTDETNIPRLTMRYTTDVIGSCAFGVNPGSMKDENSPFLIMSKKMHRVNASVILKRYCRSFFPKIFKMLNFRTYSVEVETFFTTIIKEVLAKRRHDSEKRDDFLQLMMNQQKNVSELKITDELIISNSFIFMLAGLDTTSTTLSFCMYEISKRQELQDELRREICECYIRHNGLTYESVSAMNLLFRTILETLRMHSPSPMITRLCTADCKITGLDMRVKDLVMIPIQCIQNDPRYFPEPDRFNPDRFIDNLNPPGLLAFGGGPRICLGTKFAHLTMLAALAEILRSYAVEPCSRTTPTIHYETRSFILKNKGGIWLRLRKLE